jgi:hypothetical protein
MSLAERLRLQGLPVDYLRCRQRSGVSKRQLGMMIGNAMSGDVWPGSFGVCCQQAV